METHIPHRSTLEEHPEHVKAIGMLTIEMGNLEVLFVQLLSAMLQVTEKVAAAILLTPKSTRARLDMISNIAALVMREDQIKVIDRFTKRAGTILGKRNDLVHEIWGVSSDLMQVLRVPGTNGEPKLIELEKLQADIKTLRKLGNDIMYFTRRLTLDSQLSPHYFVNVKNKVGPEPSD